MKELKEARVGMIAVAAVILKSFTIRLTGTRRLSSGMMTLAVVGAVLLVAAGGASAATAITECQEITEPGEYYLAGDIDASGTDGVCIYIKADNVTLDGQGHYIDGVTPGTCPGLMDFPGQKATCFARPGIAVKGQKNVSIRNVEVKNFCTGILLYGTSSHDEYHTVENCTVHDNGNPNVDIGTANFHGIALYKKVCYSTISNNEVYGNTGKLAGDCDDNGAGISLRVYCNYNNVTNNDIHHNTLAGIYSKAGGGDCYNTLFNNTVYENGATGSSADFTGGIRFQCKSTDDNTIANNTVSDNFGPGIFVGGNDCIVSGNTVTGNKDATDGANSRGDGLRINRYGDGGGRNTQIYDNLFCDNEHLDINVHTPDVGVAGTTGDRNTCNTTSNYDDAGTTGCTLSCTLPEKPDLVITEKSETLEGNTFRVTYTMKNSGSGDAGASTTSISVGGTQVATDSVGALSAGASHTITITLDSFDCQCGTTVTVKVCADRDCAVDESDETNNCRGNTFDCPPCAVDPLLCTTPDPPSHNFGSVPEGETQTWTFDVTNCGAGTLDWTVSDDRSWITVIPTSGTDAGTVTVTINTAGLSDDTHAGTVTVASDHGTETGTISVSVSAGAVTAISECQEITEPGEYYLANDIDNSTADVCIYIKADDVTLDGKGYCIDGGTTGTCVQLDEFPSSMSGYARAGIAVKLKSNVTIKNVEVQNFCNGILLYGPSENNTVANCVVHDNGDPDVGVGTADIHGIALYNRVCNSSIMENVVYNSTCMLTGSCEDSGAGILLKVRCNHNEVEGNTVYNNTLAGIYSKAGGGDCFNKISGNTVYQNGQAGSSACFTGGIRFQCKSTDDNTIEHNTVQDNFGPGIFIGGNDCTVRNNTATGNKDAQNSPNSRGDGLRVDRYGDGGGKNTQVYENTFCNNEHLDINVENTAQNVVGDDNTCDTCNNYNDYGETCCSYNCSEVVGCVAADGTVFGCGDTVTKSCVFNGDLNCETGHGLIIGAENITIDGDSYVLDGLNPGACDSFGVKRSGIYNKGYDGVLVRNLEIKNFCNGIHLTRDGGNYVCENTIENCGIHHNGNNISSWSETHGIKMVYVFNSTIRNNSIHDQIAYQNPNPGCEDGGNGLFLYQGAYNNITENRFYNNAKAGMLIKMKPTHWNISHNHLWGNGQGGIILRCMLCNFNTIEHNNVSDNYGSGIFIGGNNNTIRYNTVCNNRDGGPYYEDSVGGHGYGIYIGRGDGSRNNTLTSNTVCGNDYLDMSVVTGVTGNTGSENACNTTHNYNDGSTTGCTYSCGAQAPKGDLNGDGIITSADAAIALQMAVRGEYLEKADVNGDDMVTSLDALMILQMADGI